MVLKYMAYSNCVSPKNCPVGSRTPKMSWGSRQNQTNASSNDHLSKFHAGAFPFVFPSYTGVPALSTDLGWGCPIVSHVDLRSIRGILIGGGSLLSKETDEDTAIEPCDLVERAGPPASDARAAAGFDLACSKRTPVVRSWPISE